MALSIIPGKDFSVNEVPTRAKFLEAALGLQIGGIPIDRIEGTIQAIVFGNVTGASGGEPPAEGWIWVDPAGNRVVSASNVNFGHPTIGAAVDHRMWRSAGGVETARFRAVGASPGFNIPLGQHLWSGLGDQTFRVEDRKLDMDLGSTPWGMAAHAADSPASNLRVVLRGMSTALTSAQATEIHLRTRRPGILTDAAGQAGWRVLNMFDGFKAHFAGTVMGFADGSTHATADGHDSIFPETAVWLTLRTFGRS